MRGKIELAFSVDTIAMTPGLTRKGLTLLARLAKNAAGQHVRHGTEAASCSSAAHAASACRCMSALAQPVMEGITVSIYFGSVLLCCPHPPGQPRP